MRRISRTLVALLLVLAAGCGRGQPEGVEPAAAPAEEAGPDLVPATVEAKNLHALAVEIEVVGRGINHRLGTVHPGMTGVFTIPLNITHGGSVEFVIHSSASRQDFRSGPMLVASGAVVDILVAARLFNSTAAIR